MDHRRNMFGFIGVALGLWLLLALPAGGASVLAELDRSTIQLGQQVKLIIYCNDFNVSQAPEVPQIAECRYIGAGQSSKQNIVGNRISRQTIFQLTYQPERTGEFIFPSMKFGGGGMEFETEPLRLQVVDKLFSIAAGSFSHIELLPQKTKAFEGEPVPVEIQLYLRNPQEIAPPRLESEGVTLGKMVEGAQSRTMVDGIPFDTVTFRTTVTPLKAGLWTLGPVTTKAVIRQPVRRNEDYDTFDLNGAYKRRIETMTSEKSTLTVEPLPPNAPPGFAGAIGEFRLQVQATPTNVSVGDPVSLKITVAGEGTLENMALPPQKWTGFKFYNPTSTVQLENSLGTIGKKIFDQVIVPESADLQTIPPFFLTFFNPRTGQYQTAKSDPLPIEVSPSAHPTAQPTVMSTPAPHDSAPEDDGLVHIKPHFGAFASSASTPLFQRGPFLFLQLLPLGALAALWFWRAQKDRVEKNPRLKRQREVEALVTAGLEELNLLAQQDDVETFFARLFRLLQEQLGERLSLPSAGITEAVLETRLRPAGVSPELIEELHALFQTCHQARYAPHRTTEELLKVLRRFESILPGLRELDLDPISTKPPSP